MALKKNATKYCGLACYRIIQRSLPLSDRFWSKVNKSGSGGCWLWTGNVSNSRGYGVLGMLRSDGKWAPTYAHRIAWELTHEPIPSSQWVLHHCDVPACVNPDHLFIGTQFENMQDASVKGRLAVPRRRTRGFKPDVIARYLAGGTTAAALAAEYNIHPMTVHRWVQAATGADQRVIRHHREAS